MNLSDLVHRSTNGHHAVEPFFISNNIHQKPSSASSTNITTFITDSTTSSTTSTAPTSTSTSTSTSISTPTTATTTTTTTTATMTIPTTAVTTDTTSTSITLHPFQDRPAPYLYDTTIYPSSQNLDEGHWGTSLSNHHERLSIDRSSSSPLNLTTSMDDQTSSPPQRHVSNLDQFYISKTFFQPTPLTSSRPSSSSSSTTPTTAVHTSPTHESNEKSSTSTSPMDESTNVPVMPLNDEELLRHKRYFRRQPLMINGDNVTADNIEDGYVQFILHHDTDTIGDGIDGLMYARRKFSSVPRTGDLSYTTWDIFVLVNKLHNGEIKNWSQLVGQLGLSDMLGRPQFAQRVKRWMHKYKIDYYFDYLMGTPFNFHSVDEKYSGCLLMGNYQKRKEPGDSGDESSSQPQQKRKKKQRLLPSSTNHVKMEYDDDDLSIGEDDKRPILMAGSRKRMQGSTLLVNGMQRHVNDTDDEEEDDDDDDNNMYNNNNEEEEEEEEQEEEEEEEEDDTTPQQHRKVHQEKELDDDEEDELASTSSTSGSPIISTSSLIHHSSSLTKTAGPSTHHLTSHKPICDSCNQLSSTVEELRAQLKQISQQMDMISSWKPAMEEQCRLLEQQVNSLTKEKETIQEQWTSWRKKIVQDLLGDPFH